MWKYIHIVKNKSLPSDIIIIDSIEEHIVSTLEKFNNHITEEINIILCFDSNNVIDGMRMVGHTNSDYMFFITIDTNIVKAFDEIFFSELTSCIVHELHHVIRRADPWYGISFREVIVSEWLACLAEVEQKPKHIIPYIKSSHEELKQLIELALKQWEKYDHRERYFGSWKLPNRSGYKLWYYLLSNYAKYKWYSSRDLVKIKAKDIIEDKVFKNLLINL